MDWCQIFYPVYETTSFFMLMRIGDRKAKLKAPEIRYSSIHKTFVPDHSFGPA